MKKETQKLDLHARLKRHSFDHAVITTFTFKASFFEDYALDAFASLQNNGNITILLDEEQYQEMLQLARERPAEFPKQANLRYLLHPVRVPGVFHPKVSLFTSQRRGLLIIGSANFTPDGLGGNAELVAAFDFEEEKNEGALPLFREAFAYLEEVSKRWPSEALRENLDELRRDTPWLLDANQPEPSPGLPRLLHNLHQPLWDQLVKRLPEPCEEVAVLSRYFDGHPELAEHALKTAGAKKLTLYTQNEVTTLTADWLETAEFKAGEMAIKLCAYSDEDHPQQLHAKAYAFGCGEQTLFAAGSANFTGAALRRTADSGNVEVLLCYPPLPSRSIKVGKVFDPEGTARILKRADELRSAKDNPDEPKEGRTDGAFILHEVCVEGTRLELRVNAEKAGSATHCSFIQQERLPDYLLLRPLRPGWLQAVMPEPLAKDVRARPTMVQLGSRAGELWAPLGNVVLVANLQDLGTQQDLKRQRQIKEARESPQRFMEVLAIICSSEDDERLKLFLTHCDIPMDLPVRLLRQRKPGAGEGEISEEMRRLGGENLRHFEMLHEAVIHFLDRHERRLERHIKRRTAQSVPNFLHILLTLTNLLLSQVERLIVAVEAEQRIQVDASKWHATREILHTYFIRLKGLLRLTTEDYLQSLLRAAPPSEVKAAFAEGMPTLLAAVDRAVALRDRLMVLVEEEERIEISTPSGTTPAQFFKECIAAKNWGQMLREIQALRASLTRLAA